MKILTLDGQTKDWKLDGIEISGVEVRSRSSLHLNARKLLRAKYPTVQLLEEVPIDIKKGTKLYFDFYIPLYKIAVEVHGEQHYAFSSFFHKTQQDFIRQRKNDSDKLEWAELNGINVKVLKFDEQDDWGKQI